MRLKNIRSVSTLLFRLLLFDHHSRQPLRSPNNNFLRTVLSATPVSAEMQHRNFKKYNVLQSIDTRLFIPLSIDKSEREHEKKTKHANLASRRQTHLKWAEHSFGHPSWSLINDDIIPYRPLNLFKSVLL